ncbi:MAG: hypothetical protein O2970_12190 [Proteobacteria bacterium]|nr:hypothetical protein [Pseudomonadota bacterium]
MKFRKLLLIIALSLITPAISNAEDCHIPPNEINNSNIELCENKTIKINAKISDFAMQHVAGVHLLLDLNTKKIKSAHENYIDFDGMQIVATYKEPFKCNNNIEVVGTVDIVDLGGKVGKSSYRNIWLRTHNYKCID